MTRWLALLLGLGAAALAVWALAARRPNPPLDHIDDAMALLTRSVPGRDAVRVGLKHTHP